MQRKRPLLPLDKILSGDICDFDAIITRKDGSELNLWIDGCSSSSITGTKPGTKEILLVPIDVVKSVRRAGVVSVRQRRL